MYIVYLKDYFMSWSTRVAALTPSTLVDGVNAEKYIPDNIKKAICDAAANLPNTPHQILVVVLRIYRPNGRSFHAEFDIKLVDLAAEPAYNPGPADPPPAEPPTAA